METNQAGGPVADADEDVRTKRAVWLAAGAYLACGIGWLAAAASHGAFARWTTVREVVGLFVVVNGPAVIALISPGRPTALLLLVVDVMMAVAAIVVAFLAPREGVTMGPFAYVFFVAFIVLAALAWRAWRRPSR